MSSHNIEFLDLREAPREDQFTKLRQHVESLSTGQTLVVVMSHNPKPYFEKLSTRETKQNHEEYCYNQYQVSPQVCLGALTPTVEKHESGQRLNDELDSYSSIFAGLPMATN